MAPIQGKNMKVSFTPPQSEVICHRLAVPDCLWEVWCDTNDDATDSSISKGITNMEFDDLCRDLHAQLGGSWNDEPAKGGTLEGPFTEAQKWILIETLEGSTWCGHCEEGLELATQRGVMKRATRKMERLLGFDSHTIDIYFSAYQ